LDNHVNWRQQALSRIFTTLVLTSLLAVAAFGQTTGTVRGAVTLEGTGKPVHNVQVTILQLKRSVETGDDGKYEFADVPPGKYDVATHLERVPDVVQSAEVAAGQTVQLDFLMRLRVVRDQVTVTASGTEETTFNSLQTVESLNAIEISEKNVSSLGELLDHELGVSKRSFGPGSSRPVIRGFDGDRVLVLQDGMRTGSLGSQSGDHGEPIDPLTVDRVEVVKGPATLLYGSNGIGGVVNAISEHSEAHEGLRGYVTTLGSTNNYQAGGSAGLEFGTRQWSLWGNGGSQRGNDYNTPEGRVTNSFTRNANGSGGLGYYPGRGFVSGDYSYDWRRYGIPYDTEDPSSEITHINMKRHGLHIRGGVRDMNSYLRAAEFSLQFNDYQHEEINSTNNEVNTEFKNRMWVYRGVLDQKQKGIYSGSFGVSGFHRDFKTMGEEALSPPTIQDNFAFFGLQKFDFKRAVLQLGGRVEYNGYNPLSLEDRQFTGFSGAAGVRIPLWDGGAFVANYSHSYRAPSLEELYNNGPHRGNAVFEIGDPHLRREAGDGIDLSLRHSASKVTAELNFFYYHIRDFIFLAPTGDVEDSLPVARYEQGTSRYTGVEAEFDVALHTNLWLRMGMDYVNAELTQDRTPLPRIPPLRGKIGIEALFQNLRINPEVILGQTRTDSFRSRRERPATLPSDSRAPIRLPNSISRTSFRSMHSTLGIASTETICHSLRNSLLR
jgi:iron complex outermembrane receptor protein